MQTKIVYLAVVVPSDAPNIEARLLASMNTHPHILGAIVRTPMVYQNSIINDYARANGAEHHVADQLATARKQLFRA